MAHIYAPPKDLAAPQLVIGKYENYREETEAYVKKVQAYAKKEGQSDLRGELIRFQVADGYAQYVVFSLKPVKLIHLPIGDAWQFQYANRLTPNDIMQEVKRQKAMDKLFSGQKGK